MDFIQSDKGNIKIAIQFFYLLYLNGKGIHITALISPKEELKYYYFCRMTFPL